MDKLEDSTSWKEFIDNFREDRTNLKLGETSRAYWGILSLLLDNHSMEGLYPQEIINELKKMSSKPTLVKALNQLRIWGLVERTPKRWIANKQTGVAFREIDSSFNPGLFGRPERKNPQKKGETLPAEPVVRPGDIAQIVYKTNDKSLGNMSYTGSVFLDEPLGQKNIKELIESGHAIEFRGILRPAGAQPTL